MPILAATSALSLASATTASATHDFTLDVEIEASPVVTFTGDEWSLDVDGLYVTQLCHGYPEGAEDWTPSSVMFADFWLYQRGEVVALAKAEIWCYPENDGVVQRVEPTEWLVWGNRGRLRPGVTTAVTDSYQTLSVWNEELQDYEYEHARDTDQVTFRLRKGRG